MTGVTVLGICSWCKCQQLCERLVDRKTGKTVYMCERCKTVLQKYDRPIVFYSRLGVLSPLLILIGIICFFVVGWQTGVLFIVVALVLVSSSYSVVRYLVTKRDKELL